VAGAITHVAAGNITDVIARPPQQTSKSAVNTTHSMGVSL
jgi:hypothetical protein